MLDLNLHHLRYFWMVAKEGSVLAASKMLNLAQPTLSMQIRTLEQSLGVKLFAKSGRHLVLTDVGRIVYRYADEMFALSKELGQALRGQPAGRPLIFMVGISDALSKLVVEQVLDPAWNQPEPIRMVCLEGSPEELMGRLAIHELDVVLSDAPAPANVRVHAYSHLLGESKVAIFGTAELVRKYKPQFPSSLMGAPFLLPTNPSAVRHQFDTWLDQQQLTLDIRGEIADSALIKVMGKQGIGLFLAPAVVASDVMTQYNVKLLAEVPGMVESFYAISV
ncbi:MAG TPA: transcriptional activator NhaR, partial [Gemmatales bacterium]|nr:transcriptional activator NhaR [Gemmatales bacterium]